MQHVFIPSTLNIYFIHLIYSFALKYINLIELFPVAQDFHFSLSIINDHVISKQIKLTDLYIFSSGRTSLDMVDPDRSTFTTKSKIFYYLLPRHSKLTQDFENDKHYIVINDILDIYMMFENIIENMFEIVFFLI